MGQLEAVLALEFGSIPIGYDILASFILRILLVPYPELPQNLGKGFKLTYAMLLKFLVRPAME